MEKLNFLYTSDNNYFDHMLTSMYSLAISHQKEDILIHILGDGYTKEQLSELIKFQKRFPNIDFRFYSFDSLRKQIEKYNIKPFRDSNLPNARFFICELIKDVDKLLYLDSDTIIVNSLNDIFARDIKTPIALVKEYNFPKHMKDKVSCYYNSGILLFNFKKWDEEDYYKKMYDILKNTDVNFLFPDQDLINLIFEGNISPLDFSYNIYPYIYNIMKYKGLAKRTIKHFEDFYTYDEVRESIDNPHIYHMLAFYDRPWNRNSIHPYNNIYDFYRLLWDLQYEKGPSESIYANNCMIPFIEAIASGICTFDGYFTLKNTVKKILKKNIDA